MPALKSCAAAGCRELTWSTFCDEHRPAEETAPGAVIIPPPAPAPPLAASTRR
jgi:hypothetical protein